MVVCDAQARENGCLPEALELPAPSGLVYLYTIEIDAWRYTLPACLDCLDAEEREMAVRFHFICDRDRFILRRGLLRLLLAQRLDCPAADLRFARGAYGKPRLAWPPADLHFNLSHSRDAILLAFTDSRDLGVDLEAVDPDFPCREVARAFFTPGEVLHLSRLSVAEQSAAFYRWWTRKEAWLKARGTGLHASLHSLEADYPADTMRWHPLPGGWCCCDLSPLAGYQGAVVIRE